MRSTDHGSVGLTPMFLNFDLYDIFCSHASFLCIFSFLVFNFMPSMLVNDPFIFILTQGSYTY